MDGHYIEPRTILWAAAEVSWQDATGTSFRAPATLEDTSLSGACIRVQRPFTIGSRITVRWHREQFAAVARNCRRDGHGFLLGVRRERKDNPQADVSSPNGTPVVVSGSGSKVLSATDRSHDPLDSNPAAALPASERHAHAAAAPAQMLSRRLRPLAEPAIARPQAQSQASGSSPRPERKVMQPKTIFPHFWRRQQDGDALPKNISTEVPVNKPNSTVAEAPSAPSPLLSYEDIYRAAGIMSPGSGYSIHKVVEMMNNERIRDLSKEVKRASVLMALDAAGISTDEMLTDATRRQNALSSYEASQRKQLEDFEARKSRENARIEEEMEKVRSHYADRLQANLDQVTKEKDALRNWQTAMQHESQRIADVIELCSNPAIPAKPATALAAAAGAHGSEKP
jgi:hypothetical protein